MTNKIPIIKVKSEVKKISNTNPNIRDVVCLIGGFETDDNYLEPTFYTTLEAAEADLYDGSESTLPAANKALKQLFRQDISGVLCVNVSVKSGQSAPYTWARTVTKKKLQDSLAAVNQLEFDILYVAEELSDELIGVIDEDANARFEDKRPYGYIGVGTRGTTSAYTTTAGLLGDFCYAYLTQTVTVGDTSLTLLESGAWLTNTIATLPVGQSLTSKVLEDVTNIGTSYTFDDEDDGTVLVGLGYFVIRLVNPMQNTYECVNSAGANGLDLYINRVRDYIVNEFALRKYLGEKNNTATLSGIELECTRILQKFKVDMGVIENITYAVEKVSTDKVNVILNTIEFAGIITEIDVFITIEVV